MTYEDLTERSLLYVSASKPALKVLLKEAEYELTRDVDIVENTATLAISNGKATIPAVYKSMILITFEGNKLVPIAESDAYYNSDGTLPDGRPNGYFVRNNELHFNTIPTGSVNISYNATVTQSASDTSPSIPEQYHKDLCYYAIALVGAKQEGIYDTFWSLWLNAIDRIKDQSADRELIHQVRRVI